jgi:hypothetical protein
MDSGSGTWRVSTLDQKEKRQLEGQVLDRVFTDKASGRETARPQLPELLQFAREGDTVVVHSMDTLARNLDDLRALVQGLARKGVRVEFVKESLVCTGEDSPMASLMPSVMDAFAELERSLIRERKPYLSVITELTGKPSTSTCVTPTWSEPLPCRHRRCAFAPRPQLDGRFTVHPFTTGVEVAAGTPDPMATLAEAGPFRLKSLEDALARP